jgi:hypothetical protein
VGERMRALMSVKEQPQRPSGFARRQLYAVQITNAIDFQQARYVKQISHGQKNQDVANARPSQSNYTVNGAAARPPSPVTNAIVEA